MNCRRLLADRSGSSAVEFTLVLPLLLLFLIGIICAGRFIWTLNKAEKATQMGARIAVVTDMVPTGLANYNFASTLGQGAAIPTSVGPVTCTNSGGAAACQCQSTSNCTGIAMTANSTAFTNIVKCMRYMLPQLQDSQVTIDYTNAGLGYAGDPNGPDINPIVTVRIKDMPINLLYLPLFKASQITIPEVHASLTLEDGAGAVSENCPN